MTFENEIDEVGGAFEKEVPFSEALDSGLEALTEGVRRGESYEVHERSVFEFVVESIEGKLDELRSTLRELGDVARKLEPVLGERANEIGKAFDSAEGVLARGVEWLEKHREELGAALHIGLFVLVAIRDPELAGELLKKHPDLLDAPMNTLGRAFADA